MNTTWLKNLETLGEWMAYGYYEAEDKPWPIYYGRAYRRLYENMQINIFPDRLMAPCEPLPDAMTRESDDAWFATSLICDFNHHCGIRTNKNIAEIRKAEHPELTNFIDELYDDMQNRCKHYGGYTHNNPDIRRVVSEGFLAMEKELDDELSAVRNAGKNTDADELNFLLALKEYTTGIKAFHGRVLAALQDAADQAEGEMRTKRKRIAAAFANCFLRPAENFLEGLLAVHFTWMLDCCDSIGRFDQALGGLYEQDLHSGKLDLPFVRELLDELWRNFERFNSWNLQIGGRRPDGGDGSNLLTEECILACERNRFRRPNVAFRITNDTPDKLIGSVLKSLANGSGRPALYNDDLYVRTLHDMELGLSEEDAREIGFGGCTETMIAGMSNVGSLEGTINLAKAIELTINDGFDPVTAEQAGPHTGSFSGFKSFNDFFAACKRQIQDMTDSFVAKSNEELKKRFKSGDPKLYRSFFTRDCVKNHKSFESGGGAL